MMREPGEVRAATEGTNVAISDHVTLVVPFDTGLRWSNARRRTRRKRKHAFTRQTAQPSQLNLHPQYHDIEPPFAWLRACALSEVQRGSWKTALGPWIVEVSAESDLVVGSNGHACVRVHARIDPSIQPADRLARVHAWSEGLPSYRAFAPLVAQCAAELGVAFWDEATPIAPHWCSADAPAVLWMHPIVYAETPASEIPQDTDFDLVSAWRHTLVRSRDAADMQAVRKIADNLVLAVALSWYGLDRMDRVLTRFISTLSTSDRVHGRRVAHLRLAAAAAIDSAQPLTWTKSIHLVNSLAELHRVWRTKDVLDSLASKMAVAEIAEVHAVEAERHDEMRYYTLFGFFLTVFSLISVAFDVEEWLHRSAPAPSTTRPSHISAEPSSVPSDGGLPDVGDSGQ